MASAIYETGLGSWLVTTDMQLAPAAPGVGPDGQFLSIEADNFPNLGNAFRAVTSIATINSVREEWRKGNLTFEQAVAPEELVATSNRLSVRPNDVIAAAVVEIAMKVAADSQSSPRGNRPLTGIEQPEWMALVAIQRARNSNK